MEQSSIQLACLERQVVAGNHNEVRRILKGLKLKRIPRNQAVAFADIAVRVGLPTIALKILHQYVYPEFIPKTSREPSFASLDSLQQRAKEKSVYASALVNLGAVDEAIALLERVDPQIDSEIYLRRALAHFKVWDYEASVPLLEKYIASENLTPYKRLIGKVNLTASRIFLRDWDYAKPLLDEIEAECRLNDYKLLLGNSLELRAQIDFFRGQYASALQNLVQAREYLENQQGDFLFYVQKWVLLCDLFSKKDRASLASLIDFKIKAKELRQWENVRDCELFEAVFLKDESLAQRIIAGTPYESYHKRVRLLFEKKIIVRGKVDLELQESQGLVSRNNAVETFDPYCPWRSDLAGVTHQPLSEQKQLLALFDALTIDLFKPSHLGLLFSRIYKDEKFNPFTSPDRVLKLLKRLNQWFTTAGVPLRVQMKKSEFSIVPLKSSGCVKLILDRSVGLKKERGHIEVLKRHFKDRSFTTSDLSSKMEVSRSKAQSLIQRALAEGTLRQHGKGRSVRYELNHLPRFRKARALGAA